MEYAGPILSALGAAAKLITVLVELAGVEASVAIYRDMLQHDYGLLEAIRDERDRKLHLLEPSLLDEIHRVARDSENAWNLINSRVEEPLKKINKKGSVTTAQRFQWVFQDGPATREVAQHLQMTHVSLASISNTLFTIRTEGTTDNSKPPFSDNQRLTDYAEVEEDSVGAALRRHHSKHYAKASDDFEDHYNYPRQPDPPEWVSIPESTKLRGLGHTSNLGSSNQSTEMSHEAGAYHSDDDFNIGSWIARHHLRTS